MGFVGKLLATALFNLLAGAILALALGSAIGIREAFEFYPLLVAAHAMFAPLEW